MSKTISLSEHSVKDIRSYLTYIGLDPNLELRGEFFKCQACKKLGYNSMYYVTAYDNCTEECCHAPHDLDETICLSCHKKGIHATGPCSWCKEHGPCIHLEPKDDKV